MRAVKCTLFTSLALVAVGCVNGTESRINELDQNQKPEGFLMVTDVVAETGTTDTFLVTCATSAGKTIQEKRTKTEIEKNELCKPVSATKADPTDPAPATDTKTPQGFVLTFQPSKASETFVKKSPNMNISADKSRYTLLRDYCLVPAEFVASDLCKYSSTEYKMTQYSIKGCPLSPGYVYSGHFTVKPSTVPACK